MKKSRSYISIPRRILATLLAGIFMIALLPVTTFALNHSLSSSKEETSVASDTDSAPTDDETIDNSEQPIDSQAETTWIDVFVENLSVNNNYKEVGIKDPRPTLSGLPKYLKDGVDYFVEYTREVGESIISSGYKISVKNFYFINSNYKLQGDVQSIKAGYLFITQRNITLTAGSNSRVYNGKDMPYSSYRITGSGIVPGDKLEVVLTGSQKNVGSSSNVITSAIFRNKNNEIVTSNYNITLIPGKISVMKAQLNITAESKTISYNDAPPLYTVTYSGLAEGETSEVLTTLPVPSSSYIKGNIPGNYTITCGGATASNYNITYYAGTLRVNNVTDQIVLTADSGSKVYDGTPLTKNTYTATGVPAGFTLEVTVKGAVTNVTDSTDGNNIIEDVLIRNSNGEDVTAYFSNIVKVPGNLTITPAPLTVKLEDMVIQYDDPVPNYSVRYTGFMGSDDESVLTGSASYTSNYTKGCIPGTYEITGSGAVASNYDITWVSGILTVRKDNRLITVTGSSDSKTYDGTPLTSNTYTVSGLPIGYTLIATVDGSATNVLDSITGNNIVSDVKIYNSTNIEVTEYFDHVVTVSGNLTILPAPLTVAVKTYSIIFNTDPPVYEIIYSGLVKNETEAVLTSPAIASCSYVKGDPVGIYPITGSGASGDNYTISYLPGNLNVAQNSAQITIVGSNASKVYDGQPLTSPSYKILGLPEGYTGVATMVGSITNVSENSTENNVVTNVQIFDPTKEDVTTNFSNIIVINGILTITPASLVAKLDDYAIPYLDKSPKYTSTYTGFVNNENESVLTTSIKATCNYKSGDLIGRYEIKGSGVTANNYRITYQSGTLTVNKNNTPITLIADSDTKVYDGTPLTKNTYSQIGDLPSNYRTEVTIIGSATAVEDSVTGNNQIVSYTIRNGEDQDVTPCFSHVVTKNGTLTITPITLPVNPINPFKEAVDYKNKESSFPIHNSEYAYRWSGKIDPSATVIKLKPVGSPKTGGRNYISWMLWIGTILIVSSFIFFLLWARKKRREEE